MKIVFRHTYSVIYCCMINHPKIQGHMTRILCLQTLVVDWAQLDVSHPGLCMKSQMLSETVTIFRASSLKCHSPGLKTLRTETDGTVGTSFSSLR